MGLPHKLLVQRLPRRAGFSPKYACTLLNFGNRARCLRDRFPNTVFIGEQARSSAIPAHDMDGLLQEPAVTTTGGLGKDCSGPS